MQDMYPNNICNIYCPYCGCQYATEGRSIRQVEYRWLRLIREVKVPFCIQCGAEITNAENENEIYKSMLDDIKTKYIARNYSKTELETKFAIEAKKAQVNKN